MKMTRQDYVEHMLNYIIKLEEQLQIDKITKPYHRIDVVENVLHELRMVVEDED